LATRDDKWQQGNKADPIDELDASASKVGMRIRLPVDSGWPESPNGTDNIQSKTL
jgi:hypothetical protein